MNFDFLSSLSHPHNPPSDKQKEDQVHDLLREEEKRLALLNRREERSKETIKPVPFTYEEESVQSKDDSFNPYLPVNSKKVKQIHRYTPIPSEDYIPDVALQMLRRLAALSENALPMSVIQRIFNKQRSIEDRIYNLQSTDRPTDYLRGLNHQLKNVHIQPCIGELFALIEEGIQFDIFSGTQPYKSHLQTNHSKLIKISEQRIRDKIGSLSIEVNSLNQEEQKIKNQKPHRTKINSMLNAEPLSVIEEGRRENNLQSAPNTAKILLKREVSMSAKQNTHSKQEPSVMIRKAVKKAQIYRQKRTVDVEMSKMIDQKPLYLKKAQQFEQREEEYNRQKFETQLSNRQIYEPMDFESIKIHEERYTQQKRDERQRKNAEIQLIQQEEQARKKVLQEHMFRGKYRYLMLKEMADKEEIQEEKKREKELRIQRKMQYNRQVSEKYKPKLDPAKQLELQYLKEKDQLFKHKYRHNAQRRVYGEESIDQSKNINMAQSLEKVDTKNQGERQFKLFKQYIRDKIEKGEIKEANTVHEINKPISVSARPNYLEEFKEKRGNEQTERSLELQRTPLLILKSRVEGCDEKLKRMQCKHKYVNQSLSDSHQIENQYLQAIKMKVALMQQCN